LIFDNVPVNVRVEFNDVELLEKLKEVEDLTEEDRKDIKYIIYGMKVIRKGGGCHKTPPVERQIYEA
jgi:hypothetical protein